jgi:hypothetical protein
MLLPLLAACGDLDPLPQVEAGFDDPVPTVRFGDGLPSLASLARHWDAGRPLEAVVEAWRDSWALPPSQGERIRNEAVRAAAPLLLANLEPELAEGALAGVEEALNGVQRTFDGRPPRELSGSLSAAAAEGDRAREARDRGDLEGTLVHALLAADHLRATTPEALARILVREAEDELGRFPGAPSYSRLSRERAERLLRGAREALADDQPTLALRRAWYALGLLRSGEEAEADPMPPTELENPPR